MINVPRHRSWSLDITIRDSLDGPLSNLSAYTAVRCQIRQKTALKIGTLFENQLVTDVVGVLSGQTNSTLTLSLTKEIVTSIQPGDYCVDALAINGDDHLVILPVIPIRFANFPTYQVPDETEIPNFVGIFENAIGN